MNEMERRSLYNRLCFTLTDYEMPEEQGVTKEEAIDELYNILVEIQNRWYDLIAMEG